jgi:hypothetical protein
VLQAPEIVSQVLNKSLLYAGEFEGVATVTVVYLVTYALPSGIKHLRDARYDLAVAPEIGVGSARGLHEIGAARIGLAIAKALMIEVNNILECKERR